MAEPVRILLAEDRPTDAELAEREIRKTIPSCVFQVVDTRPEYLTALEAFQPDLIITDYRMPQFDGLTALKLALEHTPLTPVIILTGAINEETAVACMKAGAADYVIKEHIKRLGQAVLHALEEKKQRQERLRVEEMLRLTQFSVDRARDAIHWIGRDGQLIYVNDAMCENLGYTREELLSMTIFDIDPDFPEESWAERWARERDIENNLFETYHKAKDGRLIPVEVSGERVVYGGQEFGCAYARDITERKLSEQIIQLRLRLMEYAVDHPLKDLLQKTLDEIGTLTNSPIGFYHFVAEDQKTLILQAWSTKTREEFCQAEGEGLHYPIDEAGIWADCARERRAIVHNDYMALPYRKGLPEGHAQLVRELVVPILRDENVIAILGVGNKPHNYTEKDVEIVSYVADVAWEIAKHKRAEEAVKQKQALLDESQQLAHIGSWDLDLKTNRFVWTDETYRIFGFAPQAFQPTIEDFTNTIHPDDRTMVMEKYHEAMVTKIFDDVDYRVIRPDDTLRWVHATGRVYADDTAVASRVVGTIQDITERWQAERDLHLTRFSVDNVADAVYWIDPEAQITDVNQTASRMLGYTYEELTKMSLSNIDPGFSLEQWAGTWQYLRDKGKRIFEATHRTKDNRIIPVEIISNYIKFNGRELACAVVRDITERKQAEEALRRNEEQLRLITENMVDVISQTDAQINIIYSSPSVERVFGYSPEAIIGKSAIDMIHPDDVEPALKLVAEARQRGETSVMLEYRWLNAAGDYLWIESATRLLYDEQGESRGAIFGSRDITDRKRAEAERVKLEEQLRQAQKLESIGRLAGGIAHDFNNLLVPMMGYTELGQMKLPADHSVNDYLQKIGLAAERAANLTRQILAFSRRQMLEIQLFDLNGIIIEFREMLHRLIGEDIELQLFLAPNSCQVKADQTQIEQILLNLSVNARDAMPNGGRLIIETDNVHLDEAYAQSHLETQPGNYVMLSISDTGHGIDSKTQKQIFEPFFTTKERGKGTGLGLATVFGIVKQHKGNIWVYSEPGKGTTFKIYLPRAESGTEADEVTTSELPTIYGTETVLIAEDEPMVRKLVHETLESYGYTVLEAESAAEALEIAAAYNGRIHLLLTDVIMPEMNGRELFEKTKKLRPDLIVLYMSGYTDNVIVHHGVLDRNVNFLQKPFTIRGLAKKIRSVLD